MATTPKGAKATGEAIETKLSRIGRKWFIRLGMLVLLLIAVVESYVQIRGVALHYRRPILNANLIPISLDVMGIMAALKSRESGTTLLARIIARICMWFAIVASLAFNTQSGILNSSGLLGIDLAWSLFLSAIPALCVLGMSEMLTHTHKGTTPNRGKNGLFGALAARLAKKAVAPKPEFTAQTPRQRSKSPQGTKKPTNRASATIPAKLDDVPQNA